MCADVGVEGHPALGTGLRAALHRCRRDAMRASASETSPGNWMGVTGPARRHRHPVATETGEVQQRWVDAVSSLSLAVG